MLYGLLKWLQVFCYIYPQQFRYTVQLLQFVCASFFFLKRSQLHSLFIDMIIKKCINFSKKLHKTTCMNNSAMYNKVKSKKKIKMLICYNNEVTINSLRWLMMTSTGFFFRLIRRAMINTIYIMNMICLSACKNQPEKCSGCAFVVVHLFSELSFTSVQLRQIAQTISFCRDTLSY